MILEPTGLAAPGDILGLLADNVEDLDVLRVLTVVDAARWPMLLEVVEPLVTAQLAERRCGRRQQGRRGERRGARGRDGERPRPTSADARILAVSAATGTGMRALLRAAP